MTGNKLVMHGKASCKVVLEFDDMKITRTKRPNHLVLNDVYEDDSAQSIINERFGKSFKTTGYVSQNTKDSFVTMSPVDKLKFLESFAFEDVDLLEIKKRCKEVIKERDQKLVKITSKLEMATPMFEGITNPEKVEFPLSTSSGAPPNQKTREKLIKNEQIKYKNTEILIKRCILSLIHI